MKVDKISYLSAQLDLWPSWLKQYNSYGSKNQLKIRRNMMGTNNYTEEVMRILRTSIGLSPCDANKDLFLNEYRPYDALSIVFAEEKISSMFSQEAKVRYWVKQVYGIEM